MLLGLLYVCVYVLVLWCGVVVRVCFSVNSSMINVSSYGMGLCGGVCGVGVLVSGICVVVMVSCGVVGGVSMESR